MVSTRRSTTQKKYHAEDASRSKSDWMKLDQQSLMLKCGNYNLLDTGNKSALADRLTEFFRDSTSSESPAHVTDDDADRLSPGYDSSDRDDNDYVPTTGAHPGGPEEREEGEISTDDDVHENIAGSSLNNTMSTVAYDGTQVPARASGPAGTSSHVGVTTVTQSGARSRPAVTAVPAVTTAGITMPHKDALPTRSRKPGPRVRRRDSAPHPQPHSGTQADQNSPNSLMMAELGALRSEIRNMKQNMSPKGNQATRKRKSAAPRGGASRGKVPRQSPNNDIDVSTRSRRRARNGPTPSMRTRYAASDNLPHPPPAPVAPQPLLPPATTPPATWAPGPGTVPPLMPPVATPGTYNNNTTPAPTPSPSSPWGGMSNPFLPPPIKETLLKKIEKREFVSFKDLLPNNQAIEEVNMDPDEPSIIADPTTRTLRLNNKAKKDKINSFARWSEAWVAFCQAHLYYHPEDYYNIFVYHRQMVQHFNRFYLDACLQYDRDFRLALANQRSVDPANRTVRWGEVNRDLKILYLHDSLLPKCEHCRCTGHFVDKCLKKQQEEAASPNTLPQRIAEALQQQQPPVHPRQQQQPPRPPAAPPAPPRPQPLMPPNTTPRANGGGRRRRGPRGGAPRGGNLHPSEIPCTYYNSGTQCPQNPCPFLHVCGTCGQQHEPGHCSRAPPTPFRP